MEYTPGTTFKLAVAQMNETQKVTYGTRTGKWHIIEKGDRDFYTHMAVTKQDAIILGESACKERKLSPSIIR